MTDPTPQPDENVSPRTATEYARLQNPEPSE